MNYETATDFEINKAAGELNNIYLTMQDAVSSTKKLGTVCVNPDYNPCNNPSDAWPIIMQNMIDIIIDRPDSSAYEDALFSNQFEGGNQSTHANPLRAAMIVYLQMMELPNE